MGLAGSGVLGYRLTGRRLTTATELGLLLGPTLGLRRDRPVLRRLLGLPANQRTGLRRHSRHRHRKRPADRFFPGRAGNIAGTGLAGLGHRPCLSHRGLLGLGLYSHLLASDTGLGLLVIHRKPWALLLLPNGGNVQPSRGVVDLYAVPGGLSFYGPHGGSGGRYPDLRPQVLRDAGNGELLQRCRGDAQSALQLVGHPGGVLLPVPAGLLEASGGVLSGADLLCHSDYRESLHRGRRGWRLTGGLLLRPGKPAATSCNSAGD